ncbi:hypothetical protein IID22_05365 [Patescibacteria group bacterium]|nr:hypothetical protein [Patescibacteria group bacterium]
MNTSSSEHDLNSFQNPTGYWEHHGAFSLELTTDADKIIIPSTADIDGNIVRVHHGRIKQVMGVIQFYSEGSLFYWGYPRIKVIRDGESNLLWVNNNHR